MAGRAGFAGVLPSLLGLEGERPRQVALGEKFLCSLRECQSDNGQATSIMHNVRDLQESGWLRTRSSTPDTTGRRRGKNLKDWKELCDPRQPCHH